VIRHVVVAPALVVDHPRDAVADEGSQKGHQKRVLGRMLPHGPAALPIQALGLRIAVRGWRA
jgi:hypothetical protein